MNDKELQFKIAVNGEELPERVISILEEPRAKVIKTVNSKQ
jgi:hypothetical protein